MILGDFKKFSVRFTGIWFCEYPQDIYPKADILIYHDQKNKQDICSKVYTYEDQCSLISDLTLPEEELFSQNSKNGRNEIRRAKSDSVEIKHYSSKDILDKNEILNSFVNDYFKLLKEKKIANAYNAEAVKNYIKTGHFWLSYATDNDSFTLWHGYIADKKNVKLLYSASNFRSAEINRNSSGRINRLLHWQDMLFFKDAGVESYDWGGVGNNFEFKSGISKFKKSFGGTPVRYHTLILANSLKGKLAIKLLKRLKK